MPTPGRVCPVCSRGLEVDAGPVRRHTCPRPGEPPQVSLLTQGSVVGWTSPDPPQRPRGSGTVQSSLLTPTGLPAHDEGHPSGPPEGPPPP